MKRIQNIIFDILFIVGTLLLLAVWALGFLYLGLWCYRFLLQPYGW